MPLPGAFTSKMSVPRLHISCAATAYHACPCRCEDLVSAVLAQPPSADTIRGLDEISDTARAYACPLVWQSLLYWFMRGGCSIL